MVIATIDWVTSKIAMSVAALVIIGAVVSYFTVSINTNDQYDYLESIASTIAGGVNSAIDHQSEIMVNITSHPDIEPGRYIPETIDGDPYTIVLFNNFVSIEYQNYRVTADFIGHVHLGSWKNSDALKSRMVSEEFIEEYDHNHRIMTIPSGDTIHIEKIRLSVDGRDEYHVFVYSDNAVIKAA